MPGDFWPDNNVILQFPGGERIEPHDNNKALLLLRNEIPKDSEIPMDKYYPIDTRN